MKTSELRSMVEGTIYFTGATLNLPFNDLQDLAVATGERISDNDGFAGSTNLDTGEVVQPFETMRPDYLLASAEAQLEDLIAYYVMMQYRFHRELEPTDEGSLGPRQRELVSEGLQQCGLNIARLIEMSVMATDAIVLAATALATREYNRVIEAESGGDSGGSGRSVRPSPVETFPEGDWDGVREITYPGAEVEGGS